MHVLWNMQHRHGHQSILSSNSRVIRRVTSQRAGSPTSQNRQLFNLYPSQHAQKQLQVMCPARPCDYLKLLESSVRISQSSVSWFITKILCYTHCSLYEVFWHLERCGSWPCSRLKATGCHYTDITATIFQTSQQTVTTRHLAGTVTTTPHIYLVKTSPARYKSSSKYKVSLVKPSVCPRNYYSCHEDP